MLKKKRSWREQVLVYSVALFAALIAMAGAWIYASNSQESLQEQKAESKRETTVRAELVKVWELFPIPLKDIQRLPGEVRAYEDIDLAAKMSGAVEVLGKKEGDRVEQGETLLSLDVDSIEAELARDRANLERAESRFERIANLTQRGASSQEDYDEAQAKMLTARAAVLETEERLEDGVLTSPIDGVIDRRHIDRGEYVSPGQTVMKIVDINRVKVRVNVPEKDILFYRKGQPATVRLFDDEDKEFTGVIEWVAMTADPESLTYPVDIVVDNEARELRPGMISQVEMVRRDLDEAIAVPIFSVVSNDKSKSVFVVRDGKAVETAIDYGIYREGLVEIVDGVVEGDKLIVVGQRKVVNGEPVEIAEDLTPLVRQALNSGMDLSQLAMGVARDLEPGAAPDSIDE